VTRENRDTKEKSRLSAGPFLDCQSGLAVLIGILHGTLALAARILLLLAGLLATALLLLTGLLTRVLALLTRVLVRIGHFGFLPCLTSHAITNTPSAWLRGTAGSGAIIRRRPSGRTMTEEPRFRKNHSVQAL